METLLSKLRQLGVTLRADGDRLRLDAPAGVLTEALRDELRVRKLEILEFVGEAAAGRRPKAPPITRVARDGDLPLSFAQRRLWFLDRLGAGAAYNTRLSLRLRGALDTGALQRSLEGIVRRHEALRTTFPCVDGKAVQRVAPALEIPFELIDLRDQDPADRESEALRLIDEEVMRLFDLEHGPLARFRLYRLDDDDHVLLFTVHHIIFDGWSVVVFKRELSEHYRAFAAGEATIAPDLPVQYGDFTVWQRNWLQGETLDGLLVYWREQLGTDLPQLDLPTDRPRPAVQSFEGDVHRFRVPPDLLAAAEALSRSEHVTTAITLLAVFNVLLARYTGQNEIIIGSPIANRNYAEIEGLIGFFVNSLVLRNDLSGDPTFAELLTRVQRSSVGAYDHQDLPFEWLVDELNPERDLSRNPIFQIMFAMQNAPQADLVLPGIEVEPFTPSAIMTRFDLEVHLDADEEGLLGRLIYNRDLFDRATLERLSRHYLDVLKEVVRRPEARVSELTLLSSRERRQLIEEWNDTAVEYPSTSCVHELFEQQAAATPDAIALSCEGKSVTYDELNRRANQVAHALRRRGVGPEVMVGLCVERSVEMVVGVLGILKAGGAYVPLDPSYPASRLALMLEDTHARVLLTQASLVTALPSYEGELIRLDTDWNDIAAEPETNPPNQTTADNLAYVMYTSGSTGRPKGVCVPHRSIVRLVRESDFVQVTPEDRVGQVANVAFDAATFEIWGPLLNGGRIVVIEKDVALAPSGMACALRDEGVTVLFVTTALFNQLSREVPDVFASLRCLMFGGEAVDPARVGAVLAEGCPERLLHVYGPTENTTFSTWYEVEAVEEGARTVPIGRPIANSQVYLLDAVMNPVPVGAPGELYTGGDGLARGYLNDAALTATKFVPNPFDDDPESRLYRTGDQARYRDDGTIEFLGRIDHQVKVRGYRIELGEIESALSAHEGVEEAVVLCREDEPGEKRLIAYVVPETAETLATGDLRSGLRERLPDYMMPTAVVILESMPINRNGKIDHSALPEPDRAETAATGFVAPRTPAEQTLAAIWLEVLRVERVGIHDDFFYDLGGHSLVATRVVSRVRERFGVSLSLASIFDNPTVAGLAGLIDAEHRQEMEL